MQLAYEPMKCRPALRGRCKKRPVIEPSGSTVTEFFDIAVRNLHRVIRGWAVDVEERFVSGDEFDSGGARRERRGCLKKSRIDLKCGDPLRGLAAEFIHANRAEEANIMLQPPRVSSKVQGRSAQPTGVREYVPEDFTQGHDTLSTSNL